MSENDGRKIEMGAEYVSDFLSIRLMAALGAASTSIRIYDEMLTGKRKIGKTSMAIAAYDGRDYIADIREKRAKKIALRVRLAIECEAAGMKVRKIGEYRKRAAAIEG